METNTPNNVAPPQFNIRSASALDSFVAFIAMMTLIFSVMAIAIAISVAADLSTIPMFGTIACGLIVCYLGINFLLTKLVVQKLLVEISGDGVTISNQYKPFYDKSKAGTILWTDIASYKANYYPSPKLTLYLHNGKKIKFAAFNLGDNSQLTAFAEAFEDTINNRKATTNTDSTATITRKKTIYEGRSGLLLAWFFIILIGLIIYGIIFLPDNHQTKDVIFASGYALAGLGYVFHIFRLRKKAKEENETAG